MVTTTGYCLLVLNRFPNRNLQTGTSREEAKADVNETLTSRCGPIEGPGLVKDLEC